VDWPEGQAILWQSQAGIHVSTVRPLNGNLYPARPFFPTRLLGRTLLAVPLLAAASGERTLARVRSRHNDSRVAQRGALRTLYSIRRGIQYVESQIDLSRPISLELDCTRTMMAGYLINPSAGKILMIGLGGGQITNYLFARGLAQDIDSVDIDAEVVRLARAFFHVPHDPRYRIRVSDGGEFLSLYPETRWDMIILDAFNGAAVPHHLRTAQFYELCRSRLRDGGVVVANLHNRTRRYKGDLAALSQAFRHCYAFTSERGDQTSLVAQHGEPSIDRQQMHRNARALQPRFDFDLSGLAERYAPHREPDRPVPASAA
jgi:spermidine synthase